MATTRFIDHLLEGDHASRPSAGSVPQGTLYSCTTHTLIYQSDGVSTWSTWFTGATGMTDPMTTRGDIIIRNASNVTDRLGRGSAGTVLTSDGTDVAWAAAAGGAEAFLQRLTPSGVANVDFTGLSSTYETYIFDLQNMIPATDSVALLMRVGTGGGPTYDTGNNYNYANLQYVDDGASTGLRCSTGTSSFEIGNAWNNTANQGGSGRIIWWGPANGASRPRYKQEHSRLAAGSTIGSVGGGRYLSTTAITGFRFFFSSGNITSGIIDVYGVKHA